MSLNKVFIFLIALLFAQIPSHSDPPTPHQQSPPQEVTSYNLKLRPHHLVETLHPDYQDIPIMVENCSFELRQSSRDSTIANGFVLDNTDPFAIVESRGFHALKTAIFNHDGYSHTLRYQSSSFMEAPPLSKHNPSKQPPLPPEKPIIPHPTSTPWPKRVTLSYNHTTGECLKWWNDYAQAEVLFAPHYRTGHTLPMLELQVQRFNHDYYGANIGVAGRHIPSTSKHIRGFNLFYDYRRGHKGSYHQVGLGMEILSKRWDFRANGYIPLTYKHTTKCHYKYPGGYFAKHHSSRYTFYGINAEVGYLAIRSKHFLLYGAAGPYCLFRPSHRHSAGGRARLRPQYRDYFAIDLCVSTDTIYKTVFQAAFIFNLPLYQYSSRNAQLPSGLTARQVYQPIERFDVLPLGHHSCWHTNF